jgi:hypothetical protein
MGISSEPIARFENEGWISRSFDAQKAREVLEAAGIEFVVENAEAGVRLTKGPK